jgi:hypothetical protein
MLFTWRVMSSGTRVVQSVLGVCFLLGTCLPYSSILMIDVFVPPKRRWNSTGLHGVTSQKIVVSIATIVGTPNPTYFSLLLSISFSNVVRQTFAFCVDMTVPECKASARGTAANFLRCSWRNSHILSGWSRRIRWAGHVICRGKWELGSGQFQGTDTEMN